MAKSVRIRRDIPALTEALEPRTLLDASLLKDLNTDTLGNSVAAFADLNGTIVFSGRAPEGRGLYASDGTPAGTTKLASLVEGASTFGPVYGGSVYFVSETGGTGVEPWKTDGTADGTVRVKDIYPGVAGSGPRLFHEMNGELYFVAYDATHGVSFWKTDGTEAGTTFVYDPNPQGTSFDIGQLKVFGQYRYYSAPGVVWKADADFTTVQPLLAGSNSSAPTHLTAVGDKFVFTGTGSFGQQQLYASDGTPAGTFPIVTGAEADPPILMGEFVSTGPRAFFTAATTAAGRELWTTDGTAGGTRLVRDLNPGSFGPEHLAAHDGLLYFDADDGAGRGVWRTDGTGDGTVLVRRIDVEDIVPSGDAVYFNTRVLGTFRTIGLWKTDGTDAGTALVKEFAVGLPLYMTPVRDGGVAFTADDGVHGYEPWISDGTTAGTAMMIDLDARNTGSVALPTVVAALGDGRTLFTANDGDDTVTGGPYRLWITDGTPAGTTRVTPLARPPGPMTVLGGVAYWVENPQTGVEKRIWRSDGTAAGTRLAVPNFRAESGSLVRFGDALYSIGRFDGDAAVGLFRTDGTPGGTVRVTTFPTDQFTAGGNLVVVGEALYFTVTRNLQALTTSQLWRSDGTETGTVKLRDFPAAGNGAIPSQLVDAAGTLYFLVNGFFLAPPQLWRSDGTASGTVLLRSFHIQTGTDVPTLTAVGGTVYVAAAGTVEGDVELWKSDSSMVDAERVKDIYPGNTGSFPRTLRAGGGRLLFSAADPEGGRELWVSDGTTAGTTRVIDLRPGALGSDPTVWGLAGGRVYFTATDGVRGRELWSTDGTEAGTVLVQDINPGADSSFASVPLPMQFPGGGLLFWANDGVHGSEPWTLPIVAPPSPFIVGRHVFYNNSRFDGRDVGANRVDDSAIATDKVALEPGGAASFQNVTGYSRGINGVMVDLTTRYAFFDDVRFKFDVGTGGERGTWAPAPEPLSITRRTDHLPLDIARMTIIWPDGAIKNKWLRVTAEATFEGNVVDTDVFYFGNLVGETNDLRVTATDYSRTRAAVPTRGAGVDNPFDHNRDGFVNVLDTNIVRGNLFATLDAPATAPEVAFVATKLRSRFRPALIAALAHAR
jgi:ELWxxDGT repeat protein